MRVTDIARVYAPGHKLHESPLARRTEHFVDSDAILAEVLVNTSPGAAEGPEEAKAYMRAGPRRQIFYREKARAVIVTCGGIAPGEFLFFEERGGKVDAVLECWTWRGWGSDFCFTVPLCWFLRDVKDCPLL